MILFLNLMLIQKHKPQLIGCPFKEYTPSTIVYWYIYVNINNIYLHIVYLSNHLICKWFLSLYMLPYNLVIIIIIVLPNTYLYISILRIYFILYNCCILK